MPRTARTTTALIASLSLMVPSFGQVALAQDANAALQALLPEKPLDGKTAAALNAEQARFQPELSAALMAELAAGLTPEMLKCADGAAPPCAAEVPLVTPSGIAVELAENGTFVLMPAEVQEKALELTGLTPAHAAEKAGLDAEEAKAAEEAAKSDAAATAEAEKAAADAVKAAEARAKEAEKQAAEQAKAADEAANAAEKQAEVEAKAAEKAADEAQKQAADEVAKARAATESADNAPKQAAATDAQAAMTGEPAKAPPAEAPAPEAPAVEAPAVAADEADAKALEKALAAEQGAQAEGTTTAPAAVPAATPEAKAETTIDDLTKAIAAEGKADDPTVQPEAVAVETEAAKAAAAATEAPVAAALHAFTTDTASTPAASEAAAEAAPKVEEVKVTEDGTRTSSQDFDTSVADAARKAVEQLTNPEAAPATTAESDSGLSDLGKLAVVGLGALAVGTMLNNNRRVSLNTGDRIVVTRPDGSQEVIKDENVLLFRPGSDVRNETFADGSTRTIVTREDGSQIVTVRDAGLRVLKRVKVMPDGSEIALIDETEAATPVQINLLPAPAPAYIPPAGTWNEAAVREALARETAVDRRFTLNQVRNIPEVRALVAPVEIEAVTFDTGSAAIKPDQARALSLLGTAMQDRIARNPREMFLIEGHTDTVGQAGMNLALSDRRAESVALALTEYFNIPPENMVVQGYGEQFLKVRQEGDVRANRRAAVRRITDLLQTAANN